MLDRYIEIKKRLETQVRKKFPQAGPSLAGMLEQIEKLQDRVASVLKRCLEIKKNLELPGRNQFPQASPSLAGMLEQIGLPSLLTMLEVEKKDGVMGLTNQSTGETGCIFLHSGRVVAARLAGQAKIMNEEVIYHFLGWSEGQFEFTPCDVDIKNEIDVPTAYLLLEGMRRLDETARNSKQEAKEQP